MYNIKIYDRLHNFKTTLSEKLISCDFNFSASIDSWFSSLKINYFWDYKINHRDIILVYKGSQLIYQGFVTWVNFHSDRTGKRQIITCRWMIGLLAFKPYANQTITNDPGIILRDIFSSIDGWFNISWIKNYGQNISIEAKNLTYLTFMQEVVKQIPDRWLFVDEHNKVRFSPYEINHSLTYMLDCYSIDIQENSTDYFNKINLKWYNWTVTSSDVTWIELYWESVFNTEETEIKNASTANLRAQSILKEKNITKNYQILVNDQYNYYSIKPGQLLTVKNSEEKIMNKKIKQVLYWKESATITLDSYKSLEHFILKQ